MIFSSRLCWSVCLDNYAVKATRIVCRLRSIFNNLKFVDTHTAFKIFDIKVKPILLYGAEIWGTEYQEIIEKIQIKFCKAYLGVGKSTPNLSVLMEVRRRSLCTDYMLRSIRYWCKILHTDNKRFIKKCYTQQYISCESQRDTKNWASKVKLLLNSIGFGYAWYAQEVGH